MNKNWIKGGSSPNPAGRPKKKRSSPTIARMIERFVQRNVSPRKLQTLFDGLKPYEKMQFLSDLLPYALSKKPVQAQIGIGSLSDEQLSNLHAEVMSSIGLLTEGNTGAILGDIQEAEIIPDEQARDN